MGNCCGEEHSRLSKKKLEMFLTCSPVKEFYYKKGLAQAYHKFLEEIKNADISLGYVYIKFFGNSNDLAQFKIACNQNPKELSKTRDYGLEFEIERIITSRDDNFFYELNFSYEFEKKGFNKMPVLNNKIKI